MSHFQLPFQPIRSTVYTPAELFEQLILTEPQSFSKTKDFDIYSYFVRNGGANSGDFLCTMMQSLHDNSITIALRGHLEREKCVAVMGGHDMNRDEATYKSVAILARSLTRAGFLLASGGGPGAMEATHLGALTAGLPERHLDAALALLSAQAALPKGLKNIVGPDGTPNPELVALAHARWRFVNGLDPGKRSLAVPTWNYGHEPTTPFATDIAKYFQNSIREDGLVSIGKYGVVFTEGKAGTIQEIFQDTALNYYAAIGAMTPMVFLGVQHWQTDYPVWPVLEKLFTQQQLKNYLLLTDDLDAVIRFIQAFKPPS